MRMINLGGLAVSKLILGSNPFSGFSHQGEKRDAEMRSYYNVSRIKEVLRDAERLGINSCVARADHHIMRVLLEYWDEGGTIQWIAQTCPLIGTMSQGVKNAIDGGAKAVYIHGGHMDSLWASGRLDEAIPDLALIKEAGLVAGIAGHETGVFTWAEDHMDVDFYMCSYYNPQPGENRSRHDSKDVKRFSDEERSAMDGLIQGLSRPTIHYKVLAAGRNDPSEALSFVASHLRSQDAVCLGIYTKDNSNMLEEDLRLLERELRKVEEEDPGLAEKSTLRSR